MWKDKFVYKNSAVPGELAQGAYFDAPLEIIDPAFIEWFQSMTPDMVEIPVHLVPALDAMFANPDNQARAYS